MNIAQHVERGRQFFPHRPALLFEGQSISYANLDRQASKLAQGLGRLGIQPGDRVALLMPNIPQFVVAYLGALKIGAIVVSLNVMLKREELLFALNDCGAAVLITTAELRAELPALEATPLRTLVIAEGPAEAATTLDQLMNATSDSAPARAMAWHDPAAIVYTSGTTGFPKGATLSHGNIISNMRAKQRYCGTRAGDRLLLFLPLFHCFGQNAILNNGLYSGATVVLQRRFDPEQTVDAIRRQKVTMFFGVPAVFIRLLAMGVDPLAFASVRYFFAAGATLPVEIARRWQAEHGARIYEGYGLTETSPFASYNHISRHKLGSIGAPIEGVQMRVVDPAGQPLLPGERGEIVIRGPNVMLGYWNRPSETAQAIRDGWFHTGDVGVIDEEGYGYIVDRLKDMINVAGFKVYPAEVENAIYQHPAVAEVAVYGAPDQLQGETVRANIVLRVGHTLSEGEISAFCRARIANFKVPQVFEFVESIPKNPAGKTLKRALRETVTDTLRSAR